MVTFAVADIGGRRLMSSAARRVPPRAVDSCTRWRVNLTRRRAARPAVVRPRQTAPPPRAPRSPSGRPAPPRGPRGPREPALPVRAPRPTSGTPLLPHCSSRSFSRANGPTPSSRPSRIHRSDGSCSDASTLQQACQSRGLTRNRLSRSSPPWDWRPRNVKRLSWTGLGGALPLRDEGQYLRNLERLAENRTLQGG